MVEAVVEFAYEAEQDDELSLKIGDVIKNVIQSDGGWWEGEVNGKKGMFPENFVKIKKAAKSEDIEKSPGIGKKEAPQRKSVRELASKFKDNVHLGPLPPKKKQEKKKKCKVLFEYNPEHEDELKLQEGELVDFIREVEDGWWEGAVNGKTGVFPSNFVEMCEETEESSTIMTDSTTDKPDEDTPAGSVHEIKGKKVIGIGLGNIFQGGPIKLKTHKKDAPPTEPKKPPDVKEISKPPEPAKPPPPDPSKPLPPSEPVRPPPVADHPEVVRREKKGNRAVVRFSYAAEQPDELSLKEGETITVLDTNLEDEGWWKGEVGGKVGVFPDNFVELVPEEAPKPKKPPPPSISTIPKGPPGGGPGKTSLYPKLPDKVPAADPVAMETKKHEVKHDGKHKPEPISNKKDHADTSSSSNDRVAPLPHPIAAKKSSVPPPVGKKPPPPKPDPPKPEPTKVDIKPVAPVAMVAREVKKEVLENEEKDVAGDNDKDFEAVETTSQKLIHLTASRAKGPKKRPPSIFNQDFEKGESQDSDEVPTPPSSHPPVLNDSKHPPPTHKDTHKDTHKLPQAVEVEKKVIGKKSVIGHVPEHSNHVTHHPAPPRPPEPVVSSVNAHHGPSVSASVLEELQKEIKDLKSNSVSRSMFVDLRADYEHLKKDMETFRTTSTKKIRELMMEVDEEKKLRLNTQVEIERIKKLLAETNV